MKTIFLIQDILFNKRINYLEIAQKEKYQLYLITYHATQNELNQYIQNTYPADVFCKTAALETLDANQIRSIIANHILECGPDILIVTNAESAVSVCGQLRKDFSIDDDDMLRYVDKIAMKQALNHTVKIPKYIKFSNKEYLSNPDIYLKEVVKKLGIPFFVKPTNEYSSRGTMQINRLDEFNTWHLSYENNSHVEIDEIISGTLYHCDSFIKDGKILYTQVCEYLYPCYDFILGKPLGGFTLPENCSDFKLLDEYNTQILKQLNLPKGGLTHLEVFKCKDTNELVFLEVAARPPGAQIPAVYQKSFNISIREAHILLQIDPCYRPNITQTLFSGYACYPIKKGTVIGFNTPIINSEHTLHWDIKLGDKLNTPNKISDVACSVVLWNKNFDQLKDDLEFLKTFSAFTVDDQDINHVAS